MKTRLFSLSKTHSTRQKRFINPFKRGGQRGKISLSKPGRGVVILGFSILFLLGCFVLFMFPSMLPQFTSDSKDILSPRAEPQSLSVFNTRLKEKSIQFDTMRIATESPTVVVYLSQGGYAYLDLHTDAKAQVNLLSSIISRIQRETDMRKLKFIDLRPDKPVVKY